MSELDHVKANRDADKDPPEVKVLYSALCYELNMMLSILPGFSWLTLELNAMPEIWNSMVAS